MLYSFVGESCYAQSNYAQSKEKFASTLRSFRRRGVWRRRAPFRRQPPLETDAAALVEFIEVVSCGFAPMTVDQLSAGTAFEVKCPFAIDAIAAGYRAGPASWGK